jgi:hypothetical protein
LEDPAIPRFYEYHDLVTHQPVLPSDISSLANQVSRLPPFSSGVAVICGSVAWGSPSWRSDIDVVTFKTESFSDITPVIENAIKKYRGSTTGRLLIPRVDTITVGTESQHLVTRDNLVTGSMPITQMQTVREVFASTSLRFFDHIGSLAKARGEPWRTFHSSYLSQVSRKRRVRRGEIRTYAETFADTWRQEPLHSLNHDPDGDIGDSQLKLMSFAESFPLHLMRQILAERGHYPSPDRASDVRAAFARLSGRWAANLRSRLDPFLRIGEDYTKIVDSCRSSTLRISAGEYNSRLAELFGALPFAEVEDAVSGYLSSTSRRLFS